MHKMYEFVCRELKELEDKVDKGLSATDLENAVKLTELKKNILKIEMLEDKGYSADEMYVPRHPQYNEYDYSGYGRMRYSRKGRSRATEDIIEQLEDMKSTAPDENTRYEIAQLIRKMKDA